MIIKVFLIKNLKTIEIFFIEKKDIIMENLQNQRKLRED